jgi:hypothetical protein
MALDDEKVREGLFVVEAVLPAWVKKRDGRVVPFDPDIIGQDLFTAAESLGTADPFLTRELTDGVLHFLAAERTESIPATDWIAELVVKVVRELRQPRLASAFAQRTRTQETPHDTPAEVARRSLQTYSLGAVFSRDLAAAHRDGLLTLTGLEAPRELAGAVLTPREHAGALQTLQLLEAVLEAKGGVAGWLALDGAEYYDLEPGSPPLPRLLAPVLLATGLKARLQLNVVEPPAWASTGAAGPLFTEAVSERPRDHLAEAVAVVQNVLGMERSGCPFVIDWHLSERDFGDQGDRAEALGLVARAAMGDYPIVFHFERRGRPCLLGPGLDRLHSYLLLSVGLNLGRLLEHTGAGVDLELFLKKLGSLARLAVSAGVQKRQYLRQTLRQADADRPFLQRGFLLDRARLMVSPLGLDGAVRTLTGHGLADGKPGVEAARRILQQLDDELTEEGRRRMVDCVIDSADGLGDEVLAGAAHEQTAIWGRLHAVSGTGTAVAALADHERISADQVARFIESVWRETAVCRLRFQPRPVPEEDERLLGV